MTELDQIMRARDLLDAAPVPTEGRFVWREGAMTTSSRNYRRYLRRLCQRLSTVNIDYHDSPNLEAILRSRCRLALQRLLPNVTIDRVEAFLDPLTDRLLVRIFCGQRHIELLDDPKTFPSRALLAKVVLFAQD